MQPSQGATPIDASTCFATTERGVYGSLAGSPSATRPYPSASVLRLAIGPEAVGASATSCGMFPDAPTNSTSSIVMERSPATPAKAIQADTEKSGATGPIGRPECRSSTAMHGVGCRLGLQLGLEVASDCQSGTLPLRTTSGADPIASGSSVGSSGIDYCGSDQCSLHSQGPLTSSVSFVKGQYTGGANNRSTGF
jgi:hypothetical protein